MSFGEVEGMAGAEAALRRSAATLSRVVDAAYHLLVQTHVYHRNLRGPLVADLHKLLDEHYDLLFRSVDELAGRMRALGLPVPADLENFPSDIRVPDRMPSDEAMVADLVARHEQVAHMLRGLIAEAGDQTGDQVVQGLDDMLAFHEKAAWDLRLVMTAWPNRSGCGNGSGRLRAVRK